MAQTRDFNSLLDELMASENSDVFFDLFNEAFDEPDFNGLLVEKCLNDDDFLFRVLDGCGVYFLLDFEVPKKLLEKIVNDINFMSKMVEDSDELADLMSNLPEDIFFKCPELFQKNIKDEKQLVTFIKRFPEQLPLLRKIILNSEKLLTFYIKDDNSLNYMIDNFFHNVEKMLLDKLLNSYHLFDCMMNGHLKLHNFVNKFFVFKDDICFKLFLPHDLKRLVSHGLENAITLAYLAPQRKAEILDLVFTNDFFQNCVKTPEELLELLEWLPDCKQIVIDLYVKTKFPKAKILKNIPYVIEQNGPNCGYYDLAAIANSFSIPVIARNCDRSHPIYHKVLLDKVSLKKRGKKFIPGIGGIFDVKDLQEVAKTINLESMILNIKTLDEFKQKVMEMIDDEIPMIIPYNREDYPSAHYANIIGYEIDKENRLHIIIAHDGDVESLPAELLFAKNDSLTIYPESKFLKREKGENYTKAKPDETNKEVYREYIQKEENHEGKLRHRFLAVFPQGEKNVKKVIDPKNDPSFTKSNESLKS